MKERTHKIGILSVKNTVKERQLDLILQEQKKVLEEIKAIKQEYQKQLNEITRLKYELKKDLEKIK